MKRNVLNTALLVILTTMTVRAQEVVLQYTDKPATTAKRMIADKVYYLSQTNLWHLITAKYVRPQVYLAGWVVTGKVDGGTNTTFVLKNPPTEALNQFTQLKSRYQEILPIFNDLQAQYEEVSKNLEAARLEIQRIKANPGPQTGGREDREIFARSEQAYSDEKVYSNQSINLYDRLNQLQLEIDQLKSHGMDLNGEFVFSCYAAQVQQVVERMPVFDRGRILP